jgi:hypothetical protein
MRAVTVRAGKLGAAAACCVLLASGVIAAGNSHGNGSGPAHGRPRPASLAPRGAAGSLSAAQAAGAARVCAAHAAAAGWANNGWYGGNLVTAAAICVAESGGHPRVYYCEGTGTVGYYPPVTCPSGSYDRGLWQLNSKYQHAVGNACAFRAQCNANAAYRISDAGLDFAPWAVYGSGAYARYLGAAQAAVAGLASGSVTSAVFGVCLARSRDVAGAAVVTGVCGAGGGAGAAGQWTVSQGTVRHGTLCLAAAKPGASRHRSGAPRRAGAAGHRHAGGRAGAGRRPAVVATCDGGPDQTWSAVRGSLRNPGTDRCLRDPGGSRQAGTPVMAARCTGTRAQTWWLP